MKLRKFLADQLFRVTGITRRDTIMIYDTLTKEHRDALKKRGVVFGPRAHPVRGTTQRRIIPPQGWKVITCADERILKDEWGMRRLQISDLHQESTLRRF